MLGGSQVTRVHGLARMSATGVSPSGRFISLERLSRVVMRRYVPALLTALLVLTAGCAGTFDGPTTATGTDRDHTDAAGVGAPAMGVGPRPVGGGTSIERATAGSVAAPSSAFAAAGDPGTIAVSGTGEVSADPDLAVVMVTVQARADTADAAREQVATDAARMRDAIRDLGIDDADVRTTYYQVSPRYDYTDNRQELVGYVASHGFEIRSGVDQAGAVVDTAVGNGADQVSGVQFTLSDASQRDLRQQALVQAVSNARADADAIAGATGVAITGVHSASTSAPVVVPYYGRVAEDSAGGTPTTFDTGPVTVTAHVDVAYTIE